LITAFAVSRRGSHAIEAAPQNDEHESRIVGRRGEGTIHERARKR
jgi:hypothetical protein